MENEKDGVIQLSVDEVKKLHQRGEVQIIDVRTEEEYAEGHIPGVPLRPMQEVMDWSETLDPSGSYVLVCRSGNRSQRVAQFLKANGFEHVYNCVGGMLAWDGETKSGLDP
ncbi:MAG: rhodanese-like domain-containing protein [Alicyclobacillus sp.]|nr:rhodanese-like domain-containing protein [Alicyclobacillus sp.]